MVISTSLLLQQIVWRKIFIRSVAFWQKAVASFCFHANCTGDIHGCWKGNARYCASNRCIPFVFKDKCIPEEYSIDPLVVLNYDLATEWNICIWRIQFWHFVNYHAHFFPLSFERKYSFIFSHFGIDTLLTWLRWYLTPFTDTPVRNCWKESLPTIDIGVLFSAMINA